MNEKLQYASMLEIPVSTCSVTVKEVKKKSRRKKKVNPDLVKEQLISKVNSVQEEQALDVESAKELDTVQVEEEQAPLTQSVMVNSVKPPKKRSKLSIIGAQFMIIGVLIATIFLTNAFYPESGINVFMREVFGSGSEVESVDERLYGEFSPVIALDEGTSVSVKDGIMNITGESSVYSPCDGTVQSVTKEADGTFSIEILHSANFSTRLYGLEHVYVLDGTEVFFNIPVGYSSEGGASMCFYGEEGEVISDYQIVDNSVVWGV